MLDIFSLFEKTKIDWKIYHKLIKKYGFEKLRKELKKAVLQQTRLAEIGLTNHKIAKLKKEVLKNI